MPPTAEITPDQIRDLYKKYGTVEKVADELGVSRHDVSPIIDEMPLRQVYRHRGSAPTIYSDDDLKQALRDATMICRKCEGEGKVGNDPCERCGGTGKEPEADKELTLPFYHKVAPKLGLPAAFTITQRLGLWAKACKKAGVKSYASTGPRKNTISLDDCLKALRICRADLIDMGEIAEGGEPSYERYVKWARQAEQPSGPTVRAKVADYLRDHRRSTKGTWRKALELAYGED